MKKTINKQEFARAIVAIFLMVLAWNILVVNHTNDIERDKYYATHCKKVSTIGIFSETYKCEDK